MSKIHIKGTFFPDDMPEEFLEILALTHELAIIYRKLPIEHQMEFFHYLSILSSNDDSQKRVTHRAKNTMHEHSKLLEDASHDTS